MCKQHHRNALNPFLNGLKNELKNAACKHSFTTKLSALRIRMNLTPSARWISSLLRCFVIFLVFLITRGIRVAFHPVIFSFSHFLRHRSLLGIKLCGKWGIGYLCTLVRPSLWQWNWRKWNVHWSCDKSAWQWNDVVPLIKILILSNLAEIYMLPFLHDINSFHAIMQATTTAKHGNRDWKSRVWLLVNGLVGNFETFTMNDFCKYWMLKFPPKKHLSLLCMQVLHLGNYWLNVVFLVEVIDPRWVGVSTSESNLWWCLCAKWWHIIK